jgi:hypothetical protein
VVQECEKIAQIWKVQFKFVPPHMHVTAVCLAVVLYSPVHLNGVRGPDADKAVTYAYAKLQIMHHKFYCVAGVNLY